MIDNMMHGAPQTTWFKGLTLPFLLKGNLVFIFGPDLFYFIFKHLERLFFTPEMAQKKKDQPDSFVDVSGQYVFISLPGGNMWNVNVFEAWHIWKRPFV